MRIGVFAPPWGPTATPADFDALAEVAERLGFASLWVGDHVVFPATMASRYPYNESGRVPFGPHDPLFEPLTLLSYLSARTASVALGIGVLVLPLRNPVLVARMLAGVEALSRGRLVLGVGVGWLREEFDALAAPTFDRRGEVTDEWIELLRHLWTASDRPFHGRHYRLAPVGMAPTPARALPILVGGNSSAALRRAVERGDGWHALRVAPDALAPRIARARRSIEGRGRDPATFSIVVRGPCLDPPAPGVGGRRPRDGGRTREELERYERAGVDEFVLELPGLSGAERIDALEWFAAEVWRPADAGRA